MTDLHACPLRSTPPLIEVSAPPIFGFLIMWSQRVTTLPDRSIWRAGWPVASRWRNLVRLVRQWLHRARMGPPGCGAPARGGRRVDRSGSGGSRQNHRDAQCRRFRRHPRSTYQSLGPM